jgi:hypothetical protein
VVAGVGVVVAKAVVVEARLGVLVLTLVAERAGCARTFEVAQLAVVAELGAGTALTYSIVPEQLVRTL